MAQGSNCTGADLRMGDNFGPEIMASFIANATFVIVALLFAYCTNALNPEQLSHLDRSNIAWVQKEWNFLRGSFRNLWPRTDIDQRRPSTAEEQNELSAVSKEAISRFILTLSDTQLITGLAILCDGVLNRRGIDMFKLHIVLAQAWLASTTHLATLDALRNDLRGYGLIRNFRVACMLLLLLLLVAAFVMCQVDWHWRDPVLLIDQNGKIRNWSIKGLHWFVNQLAWVFALLLIFGNYIIRIQDLYFDQRHVLYIPSSLHWFCKSHKSGDSPSHAHYFAQRMAALTFRRHLRILTASGPMLLIYTAIEGYDGSFLSSIPGIIFCYLYGVTWNYNIFYVVPERVNLCRPKTHIGFGQMIPLLLLLLPVLAAGQTYYDYNKKLDQTWVAIHNRRQSEAASDQIAAFDNERNVQRYSHTAPANWFFVLHFIAMSSVAVAINVGWMRKTFSMYVGSCIFLGIFGLELLWIVCEAIEFMAISTPTPLKGLVV